MTADPAAIAKLLVRFTEPDLTRTLSRIEGAVRGISVGDCTGFLANAGAGREVLAAAASMNWLAGQINVTIHALGMLMCLPHTLEPDERIESVSLFARNTGRDVDLETNVRIAELKFIQWRGGPETNRQNSVFKDYLLLAEHPTAKRKYLYLLATEHAIRFFRGGRAMSSVLSRNAKLQRIFTERFGERFWTVGDYYAAHSSAVQIDDVSPWLSEFAEELMAESIMDGSD